MKSAAIVALVAVPIIACAGVWYYDLLHKPVEKLPEYHGRSLQNVAELLGPPASSTKFKMSECRGEFRVELYNVYPLSKPGNGDVEILEEVWIHPRYSIALWFHDSGKGWTVLDSCRWKKGIQF